ncbi:MAG: 4Fe-4S binding protein [Dehalococcoidia bacterium]|jgi:pyruvate ferredoxin oxidoreductase delta subunit|nr:4Fe-4S binding protein [Dehalococcoidia bacterium]
MSDQPLWKQIQDGGTAVNPGSTERIRTGDWRTEVPVIDFDRCTHCMICWVDCPDSSFEVAETRLVSVDLEHCKGCGICAEVCPVHCIEMVPDLPADRKNGV